MKYKGSTYKVLSKPSPPAAPSPRGEGSQSHPSLFLLRVSNVKATAGLSFPSLQILHL